MKVDNNGSGLGLPLDRAGDTGRVTDSTTERAPKPGPSAGADRLTLSPDALAAQSAKEGAADETALRHDVIERMRQLLDRGELGQDANTLADAILDRWLGPK